MAIIYTEAELSKIHVGRKAFSGEIYLNEAGEKFVGRADGYLEKQKEVQDEVDGSTLGTNIKNIGKYTKEEVIEKLDQIDSFATKEELEAAEKRAKCYSVAMSIVL